MIMDVSKQMEAIHTMAHGAHLHWLKWLSVVLCAALAALGLYTRQPPYFMFMILPFLIIYSAHQTGPHIRAASQAIHLGIQTEGLAEIEIEHSSDSETFHVSVAAEPSGKWRFEFIPLGWEPVAGPMRAKLYTLRNMHWPALIEVHGGVMYPRYNPKQVQQ